MGVEIIFYEEHDGKFYVAEPLLLTLKEAQDGIVKEPTLTLNPIAADEFFKCFADVLDKKGIKTESDYKIQGTLEATRFHLEDLRKMLKLR